METLISRLKEASVKVAAVIDEAFDPPSPVTLGQNLDEFWTELEAKAQAMQQLRDEGVPCDSRDAFERDGLVALWPKRDTLHDPLAALVTDLFSPHIELLKDPEIVAKHLVSRHIDYET